MAKEVAARWDRLAVMISLSRTFAVISVLLGCESNENAASSRDVDPTPDGLDAGESQVGGRAVDSGRRGPDGDRSNVELTRTGEVLKVPHGYSACTAHADCMFVSASCSGCCTLATIHVEFEVTYETNLAQACEDYMGGICDCSRSDEVPRCEKGMCVAVARESIRDCFSPTANTDSAGSPGSVGCRCDAKDQSTCIVCTRASPPVRVRT
jgi:hypothetical protein